MKSKIFSNKNIVTALRSQAWLPLFIAVGFLFALPVAELVMLGRWEHVNYTAGQMKILYANLWRDGFVLTGNHCSDGFCICKWCKQFPVSLLQKKGRFLS